MRWEDERYVRLYTRDTTDWLALSFDAQALFALLLRKVDRAGLLPLGKHGKRGVAIAIGHPRDWPRLEPALEELLSDGCARLTDDGATLVIPNFLNAQEANASDKARQQKRRETAAALAASQSVTPRDAASPAVTEHHAPVTPRHDASRDVTPSRAVLSRAEPSSASQAAGAASAVEDLPDATAFALEAQDPPARKPREAPPGEVLYTRLETDRAERCEAAGVPFVPSRWSYARQNKDLGPIAKSPDEEQVRFAGAWVAYCADPVALTREPPFSLDYFWRMRSRYEGRAVQAGAA